VQTEEICSVNLSCKPSPENWQSSVWG